MFLSRPAISYRMSSSGQPFPMSKLLYMYVKKLAEPLASRIIIRAKKDETFKRIICLPPANLYHFYESKIKFRVMNIGKVRMKKVPKMTEKEAIVLGGNLFSECCFYALASGIQFVPERMITLRNSGCSYCLKRGFEV